MQYSFMNASGLMSNKFLDVLLVYNYNFTVIYMVTAIKDTKREATM